MYQLKYMSFPDILTPPDKPWANLNVNAVNLPSFAYNMGLTGAIGATAACQIVINGGIVSMHIPTTGATAGATGNITAVNAMPQQFWPSINQTVIAPVLIGANESLGSISIATNGILTFFYSNGSTTFSTTTFPNGVFVGPYATTISWNIN